MRLSDATAASLPDDVARPGYDRHGQRPGIVHLGIGAFHRAHQAVYTDAAMAAGDRDWRIIGVSMRSPAVAAQLGPQDGLYTLAELTEERVTTRLIGAVSHVITAAEDPEKVIAAIASPDTHIVSLTVTEKGYLRRSDGTLDADDPAIRADMANAGAPRTIYGFLAAALSRRKAAGVPGLTLLSCDNLADNGRQLQRLMQTYLQATDRALTDWFDHHCRCPATMVDRIVPAMTGEELERVAARIGMEDRGAIVTEPFGQWVIENDFAGPRPCWERVGAVLVGDVRPHEEAKLRLLNGAHSALAYLGLDRGHAYVHEAIADREIRAVVEQLMRTEAAATLTTGSGIDVPGYCDLLLERFANRALPHSLRQISQDGSQKLPQRLLAPLALNQDADRVCPATLAVLAAWCRHIGREQAGLDDPMAARLALLWQQQGPEAIAAALFGNAGLFKSTWVATPANLEHLNRLQAPI